MPLGCVVFVVLVVMIRCDNVYARLMSMLVFVPRTVLGVMFYFGFLRANFGLLEHAFKVNLFQI